MLSSLQFAHVLAHARATNAGMTLGAHVVAKRHHHLLDLLRQLTGGSKDQRLAVLDAGLHLLENGNAEGSSFSSSRLRLRNHIEALACRATDGSSAGSRWA